MTELNEQELEQVAGGTFTYGSNSASNGGASAVLGIAQSATYANSVVNTYHGFSAASAGTSSAAAGYYVSAAGASASGSGASYSH
jgi:hypothetical protein